MTRAGLAGAATAVLLVAGVAVQGGAHMKLAFEDRADPNPRQMAFGMELAGLCLGLAISWTEHRPAKS